MNKYLKITMITLLVVAALAGLGYGAYIVYHAMVDHITERIAKGVAKGVGKGVGNIINPFKW